MTRRPRPGLRAALLAALLGATLSGCAPPPPPLYHWGDYQTQVYTYLKADGASPDDQLQQLLAQAEQARAAGAALPPGFRSHLGLLQLRTGRDGQARESFEAEKASFPESAPFMDFLLRRMKGAPS